VVVTTSATTCAYLLGDLAVVAGGGGSGGGAPVLSGEEVAALTALGAGAMPRGIVVDDWPEVSMQHAPEACSAVQRSGVLAWATAGGRRAAVSAGAAAAAAARAGVAAAVRVGVAARDENLSHGAACRPAGVRGGAAVGE
jgi:hypothetical protein